MQNQSMLCHCAADKNQMMQHDFVCSKLSILKMVIFAITKTGRFDVIQKIIVEGVVAQWCNPLTLKPEQSGSVGWKPGRTRQLERHDKGRWTQLALRYSFKPQLFLFMIN